METKEKPILYYIKGDKIRGKEVIKALTDKGCKNEAEYEGNDEALIYYNSSINTIKATYDISECSNIIKDYGIELTLPNTKTKVLKWNDIKSIFGYFIDNRHVSSLNLNDNIGNLDTVFATEQQAASAKAAAMISQIREHGKETYGKIVPKGYHGYTISTYTSNDLDYSNIYIYIDLGSQITFNNLLTFESEEQAKLFLDNNKDIVKEYLKTF